MAPGIGLTLDEKMLVKIIWNIYKIIKKKKRYEYISIFSHPLYWGHTSGERINIYADKSAVFNFPAVDASLDEPPIEP